MSNSVLITGASQGLGKAMTHEFYNKGYNLILNGRDKAKLDLLSYEIGIKGIVIPGDLREKNTIDRLIEEAEKRKVSILVNSAGVYLKKTVAETSESELREVMETNFFSAVNLTTRILPFFVVNGGGTIININSVAGDSGSYGESAYAASKHAINGFFDSMRYEVARGSVRITNVALGAMQTEMSYGREDWDKFISPEEAAKLIVSSCIDYKTLCPNEIRI